MQNFVVIGDVYFELKHSVFWFKFDQNIVSGTGGWSPWEKQTCCNHCASFPEGFHGYPGPATLPDHPLPLLCVRRNHFDGLAQDCGNYRKISNTRCTKSPNLNVSRLVLQLSLPNAMKPGVKSRMKMQLEQRRQAMLQLHLSDRQFYNLLRCVIY